MYLRILIVGLAYFTASCATSTSAVPLIDLDLVLSDQEVDKEGWSNASTVIVRGRLDIRQAATFPYVGKILPCGVTLTIGENMDSTTASSYKLGRLEWYMQVTFDEESVLPMELGGKCVTAVGTYTQRASTTIALGSLGTLSVRSLKMDE